MGQIKLFGCAIEAPLTDLEERHLYINPLLIILLSLLLLGADRSTLRQGERGREGDGEGGRGCSISYRSKRYKANATSR